MSRLTSATNPESGTVNYTLYDDAGNLETFTDANGTIVNMLYDALSRIVSKSYNPGTGVATTPNVTFSYDQDFRGALSSVTLSNNSSGTTYTHDGVGRVITSTQTTGGNPYTFGYSYSLRDQLTQIVYPSGRVVGYTLDAIDRVTNILNGTSGSNYYVSSISYGAIGPATMAMGNGVSQAFTWNDRAQPTNLQVTNAANGAGSRAIRPRSSRVCKAG